MKRVLASVLAVCLVMSMAACGSSSSSETAAATEAAAAEAAEAETEEETEAYVITNAETVSSDSDVIEVLNVGISADPQDLSPWASTTTGRLHTLETMYQRLAITNGFGGELIGVLMKDYEKTGDKTYDVTLYDYIYDTEGNHMTASDVAFSYNKAIELGNMTKLGNIASVEAVDDYVVRFVFLDEPLGNLEAMFTEIPIVTEAAYEASGDGMVLHPVGTGQYKMTEYVPGSTLTFEKTHDYWQTDESLIPYYYQANAEEIVFWIITEDTQRTLAMANGTLDLCASIAASDVDKFEPGGEYAEGMVVDQMLDNRAKYLLFNCSDESVCSNINVRQAICYALDIPTMIEGVFGETGEVIYTFGNDKYSDYNDAWTTDGYYDYDPEKAEELIAESGLDNITVRLISSSGGSGSDDLCILIKEYLDMVGIDCELTLLEEAQVNEIRNDPAGWDLYIGGTGSTDYIVNLWTVVFDPDTWSHGSMNFIDDDTLYELLSVARNEETHTQDNVDAVHQYLEDNAYVYGMYSSNTGFVHTDDIVEIVTDPKGAPIPGASIFKTGE